MRQRISEAALTTCDRCGGPIHRLLAAAPFILKGGGWHVTDYPSEARKKAASAESGGKDSAGSESKPSQAKSSTEPPAATPSSSSDAKTSTDSTKPSSGS